MIKLSEQELRDIMKAMLHQIQEYSSNELVIGKDIILDMSFIEQVLEEENDK